MNAQSTSKQGWPEAMAVECPDMEAKPAAAARPTFAVRRGQHGQRVLQQGIGAGAVLWRKGDGT